MVKENSDLCSRLEFSENKIARLEHVMDKCNEKLIDCQSRMMSDTLIFHNIPERRGENTREHIIVFMKEVMNIKDDSFEITRLDSDTNMANVWIKRCYRRGENQHDKNRPRPIVVHILDGKDWVMKHAKHLAGTDYYITTQMPPEVVESKRKLTPLFKQARAQGNRPRYVARGDAVAYGNKTIRAPRCRAPPKEILSKRCGLQVITSNVVEDQGNRFVAHKVNVSAPADITAAVDAVKYSQYSIATASHNMYATRIQVGKFIHEYSDDDGEHSGSREIMNELRKRSITNQLVVVTRWASGTQLGRKRFAIISQCTSAVLGDAHNQPRRDPDRDRTHAKTPDSNPTERRRQSAPTDDTRSPQRHQRVEH